MLAQIAVMEGNEMFQIDDNVPMPATARKGGDFAKTVDAIEVGQSFFVEGLKPADVSSRCLRQRNEGKKFTSRTATEGGVEGVRIWRIV